MNRFAILLMLGLWPTVVCGQEQTPAGEPPEPKRATPLRKLLDECLAWDELFTSEQAAEPMQARVVMRWANNSRGSQDGMTVLYLAAGRPEAVCCVYPWQKSLTHWFGSLSRGTFVGKRDGTVAWSPAKPGLEFRPIPEADIPAATPSARLRQMKQLASQFTSTMLGWNADRSDRESLRLLPQPLYRYDSKRPDVLDGAVFAFVQGTDPESLLLIEAFNADGANQWQYAFAPRTSGELEGRHQDIVVWHADRFPITTDPRSTILSLTRALELDVAAELQKPGEKP